MITEITHAIEQIISPAWEQPRKVIRAIEKSAEKLAHKLSRTIKREGKPLLKVKRK